jgi:hypothetical protein
MNISADSVLVLSTMSRSQSPVNQDFSNSDLQLDTGMVVPNTAELNDIHTSYMHTYSYSYPIPVGTLYLSEKFHFFFPLYKIVIIGEDAYNTNEMMCHRVMPCLP